MAWILESVTWLPALTKLQGGVGIGLIAMEVAAGSFCDQAFLTIFRRW
jgi:hypothetical protein